ncbi:hypothetical protein QBC34DRAFT_269415, partial [Podospora aff. communis PSN243]
MDPLTIISVVAAAVQFVDFGTRLLTKTSNVFKAADAAGSRAEALDAISHDTAALAQQIKDRIAVLNTQGRPLSVSEKELLRLCDRCDEFNKDVQATI